METLYVGIGGEEGHQYKTTSPANGVSNWDGYHPEPISFSEDSAIPPWNFPQSAEAEWSSTTFPSTHRLDNDFATSPLSTTSGQVFSTPISESRNFFDSTSGTAVWWEDGLPLSNRSQRQEMLHHSPTYALQNETSQSRPNTTQHDGIQSQIFFPLHPECPTIPEGIATTYPTAVLLRPTIPIPVLNLAIPAQRRRKRTNSHEEGPTTESKPHESRRSIRQRKSSDDNAESDTAPPSQLESKCEKPSSTPSHEHESGNSTPTTSTSTSERPQSKKMKHSLVGRKYRSSLKERFERLLSVLPVSENLNSDGSCTIFRGRLRRGKMLDVARNHIESLERTAYDLDEENKLLNTEIEIYARKQAALEGTVSSFEAALEKVVCRV